MKPMWDSVKCTKCARKQKEALLLQRKRHAPGLESGQDPKPGLSPYLDATGLGSRLKI